MFPLGTVLLPSLVLPLHVFEDRYRKLVDDCLADDTEPEFGVVLIERGSEVGGGDTRCLVGTVARIVEAAKMPDGRWALACVGTRRVRVEAWLDDDPYPLASVVDWADPDPGPRFRVSLDECVALLRRVLAVASELGEDVMPATVELSSEEVLASYQAVAVSPLGPADRQRLLAAPTPEIRVEELTDLLHDELRTCEARMALGDPLDPDDSP